jgi:hypothetical protein
VKKPEEADAADEESCWLRLLPIKNVIYYTGGLPKELLFSTGEVGWY